MALVAESGKGAATEDAIRARAAGRTSLKPLRLLVPYLLRYRTRALLACVALLVAALATLAVPVAVRRMIDHGFSGERALIDNYFTVMIGVVFVLALASAFRYYLVTTLGERIVSDLREEVFAHLTRLSPSFFDRSQTGEMMSRLTADTTQIKAAVGASVSVALRNLVLFLGAGTMMVITSPKLSLFVLAVIPV
ncbi:MAG: ABC transporter transmembrane domain-containing protein, partial [Pseudorhodoplanes sp.]